MRFKVSAALLLTLSAISLASSGCVLDGFNPGSAPLPNATLKRGDHLFSFDYQHVTDLLVAKADPETGDRWAAHLTRALDSPDWTINNAGSGPIPLNQQADGFFVLHLLDTLRTLQVDESDLPGSLESMGLAPPRYALQWQAEGKGYELKVGAPKVADKNAYAWIPGQAPFLVGGATLTMLEYLKDFSSLRLKTWTGVTADDVDEVLIPGLRAGDPAFYAQREGSDWTDRKHKSLRLTQDFSAWLDKLVHQRVMAFIDDPTQAKTLLARIQASPLRKATLKDRHGHSIELLLGQADHRFLATSSARPQSVFEVFPESSQALEPPARHSAQP